MTLTGETARARAFEFSSLSEYQIDSKMCVGGLTHLRHKQLEVAFNFGLPKPEMPDSIRQNLNLAFERRSYPEAIFVRFMPYFNNGLQGKQNPSICFQHGDQQRN